MNSESPVKVQLIERSLSCFTCGLLGLIPLLGLPFAIRAFQQHWRAKRDGPGMWNPAQRYLKWGIIAARISLTVSVIVVVSIVLLVSYASIFTNTE